MLKSHHWQKKSRSSELDSNEAVDRRQTGVNVFSQGFVYTVVVTADGSNNRVITDPCRFEWIRESNEQTTLTNLHDMHMPSVTYHHDLKVPWVTKHLDMLLPSVSNLHYKHMPSVTNHHDMHMPSVTNHHDMHMPSVTYRNTQSVQNISSTFLIFSRTLSILVLHLLPLWPLVFAMVTWQTRSLEDIWTHVVPVFH